MPLSEFIWNKSTTNIRTDNVFRFQSVSALFVRKQLKDLKRSKATGPDNLPPSLLKDAADVIC